MTLGMEREREIIDRAVRMARDTRLFVAESGIRHRTGSVFRELFGAEGAVIVADGNTFSAAGRDAQASLEREGIAQRAPFVFGPHVHADIECVEELERFLLPLPSIPIAVGSGTLNDLTKLAAHRLNRPYMVVGTAASMDGYAAFGASILKEGSKETMECPGPRAVLADLEVIGRAPGGLNPSGYGDLLAKIPAGADWMLADAAGVEPIIPPIWDTVQRFLRSWVGQPDAIQAGDSAALAHLVQGLVMSGLAMQEMLTSRPASGAEHQFSHLWDMQAHTYRGEAPSHGFKVGIGTLASIALFEDMLARDIRGLEVDRAADAWPTLEAHQERILELFGPGGLARRAVEETRAKYASGDALRSQLVRLRDNWGELSARLRTQLVPFRQTREMLAQAGCPSDPAQIGISRARLRLAYEQCCYLRRRFTVLDAAHRMGFLESALDNLFGRGEHGPSQRRRRSEGLVSDPPRGRHGGRRTRRGVPDRRRSGAGSGRHLEPFRQPAGQSDVAVLRRGAGGSRDRAGCGCIPAPYHGQSGQDRRRRTAGTHQKGHSAERGRRNSDGHVLSPGGNRQERPGRAGAVRHRVRFFRRGLFIHVRIQCLLFAEACGRQAAEVQRLLAGTPLAHAAGIFGGVVWGIGTLSSFVAASAPRELQVGPAVSYALGQGSTMVGAFWGVVVWKEFKGGSPLVNRPIALMFALFILGLAVVSVAPLYARESSVSGEKT